ncbi:hypothetical protein DPEC_G00102700 [Dallia pectoralis]|uniref:Uncharacterized protein n=1 Tax=Dallia pectoralis TaxID=75939 RepID=A0ACC2GXK5_DALPE|nr:hypothetical protein DPEC_G00102700 [Dallia pectoralis]
MEATGNYPKYQKDTGVLKKRMADNKDESSYDECNALRDLDTDWTNTVTVCVTGEGSQMGSRGDSTTAGETPGDGELKGTEQISRDTLKDDIIAKECANGYLSGFLGTICFSEVPSLSAFIMNCPKSQDVGDIDPPAERKRIIPPREKEEDSQSAPLAEELNGNGDLQDMFFGQGEPDEDVSLVLTSCDCDDSALLCHADDDDESHYITTHEIQLSELSDHEVDCDVEHGWDDNQVYSFVDYDAFDRDVTTMMMMMRREEGLKSNPGQSNSGAAVSTKLERDLDDRGDNRGANSDGSPSKNQANAEGQIHLSIKTTRAINEPSDVHANERTRYNANVFKGPGDANAEMLCDSAKCVIAAPGRVHIGGKLKGTGLNEYSSGTSSAVSELDDADKEVRHLTARAFRSLACPYFDPFHFSTSSESSTSELGVNRWSTVVDLKYGNVNMSNAREPHRLYNKSSTSSSEIAKNKDNKGCVGLTTKPPANKRFALKGALSGPYNASSAAKKLELMGTFGQRHSGVITLTETLNFRCNVTSGLPGSGRRSKFAQKATGSRSADEITNTSPGGQRTEASAQPCNPGETMEDTHKKAIFASSLIKNVISKKMQFEQERKMERGEIREPYGAPSACFVKLVPEMTHRERDRAAEKTTNEFQRQSSKHSDASSDLTIVCVHELGDLVDTSSCEAKDNTRRQKNTLPHSSEANLESTNEVGLDTKKGSLEASKRGLLQSQNSAFRSWRDGELEFKRELIHDDTPEGEPSSSERNQKDMDSSVTKMSHLFVPRIQLLSNGTDVSKKLPTMNYSDLDQGRGVKLGTDNSLYVGGAGSVVTSKSPEIKLSLRSVKEKKGDPFNIARVVLPNIGTNPGTTLMPGDESRCQALAAALKGESSDKMPHFTVRDIRDHRGKLQTPIHQVRDVRKLVKSSYRFVSLDKNGTTGDQHSDQKLSKQGSNRNPVSDPPIIIKYQSVNTNSDVNVKRSGNQIDNYKVRLDGSFDVDRSSPEKECDKYAFHQPTGTGQLGDTKQFQVDFSEEPTEAPVETATASKKQEKTSDIGEKTKPECNMSNLAALEKLQAAVKTMEQLYVFDRNEWKRKSEPSSMVSDSHVLSLISSEQHAPEEGGHVASTMATIPPLNTDRPIHRDCFRSSEKTRAETIPPKKGESEPARMLGIPIGWDMPQSLSQQTGTPAGTKKVPNFSSNAAGKGSAGNCQKAQLHISSESPYCKGFSPLSPKHPISVKVQPQRNLEERERERQREREEREERERERERERPIQFSRALAEPQNYLTIPVKTHISGAMQGGTPSGRGREKTAIYTYPATGAKTQNQTLSTPGLGGARRMEETQRSLQKETRAQDMPTIYHHMPTGIPQSMVPAQPQMYCFSPNFLPQVEHFQHTQRKMLFDPSTGNYYLVDTPVQPATRRLFDPETGQYVDVPMSQQPMSPMPMSISPLALSPGSYGPTYMIYPGFVPAMPATPTLIPTRMQSQLSMQSEQEDPGDKGRSSYPDYMDSPYYVATGSGKSPQAGGSVIGQVQQQARPGVLGVSNVKQPAISVSSQQGPRIIAPGPFDGTTMGFVLEHR